MIFPLYLKKYSNPLPSGYAIPGEQNDSCIPEELWSTGWSLSEYMLIE